MGTATIDYSGFVPATRARRHIKQLGSHGIGRRSIADASDVSDKVIQAIAQGRRAMLRRATEIRILSVDDNCLGDGCLVAADSTWKRIDALQAAGVTIEEIAFALGYPDGRLRIGKSTVRAATALRVQQLFSRITKT